VAVLTIGQVAARAGLRASAIRYYEAQRLLPPALRKSGKRVYETSVLERLALIELAKLAGFELEEIRVMLSTAGSGQPASAWRTLAQRKHVEVDRELGRLALMKDILARLGGCTCATLDECARVFTKARSKAPPSESLDRTARRRQAAKRLTRRSVAREP
jgi:MerR family redox-sensitive transcriptional activator SoxR